jgi:electron transfer flavoprotein-quinone oxidoreductase
VSEERFEAIVIGGGLAGLATAYILANAGKEALLIEKGDYCGSKSVTGGRMYVSPIRDYFPDLWEKAPFERAVVQEEICMMSKNNSLLIRYNGDELATEPYQSYSVCLAKFNKFFAKQAEKKGAMIVTKKKVDSLVIENDVVSGVVAGEETLLADVVICGDGALSIFPQQAGLRDPLSPRHFAVGLKETIEMDTQVIEDRFNLIEGQGAARLYMGDITDGRFGGGFLYTNKDSISLGLVLGIEAMIKGGPRYSAPELLDRFKRRPEVAALIAGGQAAEYSAHVIGEGGYNELSKLYGNGILVTGDAAGFTLNAAITVRGMEYAMFSGYAAAQAVIKATEKRDFSARSLSEYQRILEDSFVLRDFKEYRDVPQAMDHQRLFTYYPELVGSLFRDLYIVPSGSKQRIMPTVKKSINFKTIKDILLKDALKVSKL